LTSKNLAWAAGKYALSKNGFDIKILDLRECSDVADYFVICSGSVDIHVKAIADAITDELKEKGVAVWHKEGMKALQWVLLDYVSVVVHIFQPETRKRYALEKLWGDAPVDIIQ